MSATQTQRSAKKPLRVRRDQIPPKTASLDLGNRTFIFEGQFLTGQLEFNLNEERDRFMYAQLSQQLERAVEAEQKYLQGLRNQGIFKPELPPVHEILDEENLPPGYQLKAKAERKESDEEE